MSELSISLSLLLSKERDIVLYRLNSLQAGSLKKKTNISSYTFMPG